jgi:hypothetical protein
VSSPIDRLHARLVPTTGRQRRDRSAAPAYTDHDRAGPRPRAHMHEAPLAARDCTVGREGSRCTIARARTYAGLARSPGRPGSTCRPPRPSSPAPAPIRRLAGRPAGQPLKYLASRRPSLRVCVWS